MLAWFRKYGVVCLFGFDNNEIWPQLALQAAEASDFPARPGLRATR
jgi:hypothetical protein